MSKQLRRWREFSLFVEEHIEEYVVPQYGDEGEEPATEYTIEDCVKQAQRYLARHGRNSRGPQEEERDLRKAAHWIQKAWSRMNA